MPTYKYSVKCLNILVDNLVICAISKSMYFLFRMNAEVLKSRSELPDILSIVSNHLFGQLESYIIKDDPLIVRQWEVSDKLLL